ncbi:hypothetical protein DM813_01760 [Pseudomonas alkylphenolica]|uniref:Uncharacterized protein n=1 Tax=Pseudomonas alkylphenolica TaxID=237609 RepID=A0A443ZYP6_9PSED|nr:hypothetical protein DM813_01760 [Pseudomonas alkylphenolica]
MIEGHRLGLKQRVKDMGDEQLGIARAVIGQADHRERFGGIDSGQITDELRVMCCEKFEDGSAEHLTQTWTAGKLVGNYSAQIRY